MDECLLDSLLTILKVIMSRDGWPTCLFRRCKPNPCEITLLEKNCLVPEVLSWAIEKNAMVYLE
jgi:hypothetical protein